MLMRGCNFLPMLTKDAKENNQLEQLTKKFIAETTLIPCFGVEMEFYLSANLQPSQLAQLVGIELTAEKGEGQFEVALPPSSALTAYADLITFTRNQIIKSARLLGGSADFRPKPKANDYGSSLHFHLNFLYHPSNQLNSDMEDVLYDIAAKSLCHFMLDTLTVFLPAAEDYLRLDHNFMAPTHIAYGTNNRTVAIRMPDSLPKRLEHRLSGASCDPYLIMLTILESVRRGLKQPQSIKNYPKIYGNAFDPQYNLSPLPKTIEEALILFNSQFFGFCCASH